MPPHRKDTVLPTVAWVSSTTAMMPVRLVTLRMVNRIFDDAACILTNAWQEL
jgi:hypothetical protein